MLNEYKETEHGHKETQNDHKRDKSTIKRYKRARNGHKTITMATSFVVFLCFFECLVLMLERSGDIVVSVPRGPLSHNPSIHTVQKTQGALYIYCIGKTG